MNKYQEAKETLEKYDYSTKLELSEGIRNNITSDITVEQFFMMKETCIELLDRATPKKVKVVPSDKLRFDGLCPNCNQPLFDGSDMFFKKKHYQFCAYCGQALDWSEPTTDSTHNELDNIFADSLEMLERLKIKK